MTKFAHEVVVAENGTDRVVNSIKVVSERRAEQIERGLLINLDHAKFHTEVRDLSAGPVS